MKDARRKKIRSIAVAVLVFSCAFIVLLAVIGEYAPSDSSTIAREPTATELPPFDPEAWELTFLDSLRYVELDDQEALTRVLMGVEIHNRGDMSGLIERNSFVLLDASGQELGEYHMSPYTPLPPTTVEAGETIQGDILFEIPGTDLQLEDLTLAFKIYHQRTYYDLERPAPDPSDLPQLDLREALAEGLLDVEVLGESLQRIDVRLVPHLEPEIELSFEVTILPGTLFLAPTGSLQDMVVRYGRTVMIRPTFELSLDLEFELEISVACADMHLSGPEGGEVYTVSMEHPHEDLIRLLDEPGFASQEFRVQQFAIWTITDNPGRYDYVGLSRFGISGTGPSDEEMELIRQLFTSAGIPLERYRALQ
ncbi:MAG TPA: hypothetical protein G4O08_03660 [Anaerolineae bacterium]|nr:hypothetical protein [Anaerolineae bacterium]